MKSVFKILLFAMAMTTFCVSTYAQKDNRQRMTREEFQAGQMRKQNKPLKSGSRIVKRY